MDAKARLRLMGIGAGITVVATIVAGYLFGSVAVPVSLAIGFGATLLAGGGRGKKV